MKGFIFFDVYGQTGFPLCNKLLEEGFSVYCPAFFDQLTAPANKAEKLLFIGRNANFKQFTDDVEENNPSGYMYIFPCADWQQRSEEDQQLIKNFITRFFHDRQNGGRGFMIGADEKWEEFLEKLPAGKVDLTKIQSASAGRITKEIFKEMNHPEPGRYSRLCEKK